MVLAGIDCKSSEAGTDKSTFTISWKVVQVVQA